MVRGRAEDETTRECGGGGGEEEEDGKMGQRKMPEHVENTTYWIQGSRRESRRLPRRGKCCGGRGRRGPGTDELSVVLLCAWYVRSSPPPAASHHRRPAAGVAVFLHCACPVREREHSRTVTEGGRPREDKKGGGGQETRRREGGSDDAAAVHGDGYTAGQGAEDSTRL